MVCLYALVDLISILCRLVDGFRALLSKRFEMDQVTAEA
jgi:hypothetical protein